MAYVWPDFPSKVNYSQVVGRGTSTVNFFPEHGEVIKFFTVRGKVFSIFYEQSFCLSFLSILWVSFFNIFYFYFNLCCFLYFFFSFFFLFLNYFIRDSKFFYLTFLLAIYKNKSNPIFILVAFQKAVQLYQSR